MERLIKALRYLNDEEEGAERIEIYKNGSGYLYHTYTEAEIDFGNIQECIEILEKRKDNPIKNTIKKEYKERKVLRYVCPICGKGNPDWLWDGETRGLHNRPESMHVDMWEADKNSNEEFCCPKCHSISDMKDIKPEVKSTE